MKRFASAKPLPILLLLIFLAAASRLLPHWPNFGPVGAMALFGSALMARRWMAFVVPFAALYLSDLALNNLVYSQYYEGFFWGFNGWVYAGFGLTVLLGFGLLRERSFSWLRLGGVTLGATALFFLLTNFGAWLGSPLYPQTGGGLLAAYAAGLPFLLNSAAGNLVFAGLLFGGARYLAPRTQAVKVRERV
ncbi:hypothetical protein GGR26_001396 [Lewinella marina]|uniref:Uncharacterized protein n=1 Tax=Neolewinella marina TaxID=438751 RepID=A0A2G0CFB4_9BACT|nr:DUF6580 family putative transport protein [Neolewinella marina]NJB85651.1 hypothetical protein [Neolewinella marina]PHK98666.1 hypothetical protein CGL56_09365 [Neolewinella marina]